MMSVPHKPDNAFGETGIEREKWEAEREFRRQELALKERELFVREREQVRLRWTNPLVLALAAAALAGFGNAGVAWINGAAQRELEASRAKANIELERSKSEAIERLEAGKADAARILEVIKTGDPDKAAENLRFLRDVGLLQFKEGITAYLNSRRDGEGVSLESDASASIRRNFRSGSCFLSSKPDVEAVAKGVKASLEALNFKIRTPPEYSGDLFIVSENDNFPAVSARLTFRTFAGQKGEVNSYNYRVTGSKGVTRARFVELMEEKIEEFSNISTCSLDPMIGSDSGAE